MTSKPDLLRRAEEVLFRVSGQPEASREAAINEVCHGDPALAKEVRSLLVHAGRSAASWPRTQGRIGSK